MQSTGWVSLKLVLWARIHRVAMSCTKFCHLSPSQYFFTQALPTSAIARERWGTIGYNPFWMRILKNTCKYDCLWWPIFLPFKLVTDQMFGSAELLLCGSAQMTELFSAEHRTFFFVSNFMPMASFHILVLLYDPHASSLVFRKSSQKMPTEAKMGKLTNLLD